MFHTTVKSIAILVYLFCYQRHISNYLQKVLKT